jgi:hypothetical protein
MSETYSCVDAKAVTSYRKKISILHFQSLGGFTLLAITNEN